MSRLSKRARVDHQATAARLQAHPGVWQVVGDYRNRDSANGLAHRIRTGYPLGHADYGTPYEPAGAYEARTELVDDGTRVHARYIGEDSP